MSKTVLFAFRDDPLCFVHVLLNALDLAERGGEAGVVLEGAAVKLAAEFEREGGLLQPLYAKARAKGLMWGACRACSTKMGAVQAVQALGLPLLDDMSGHPSLGRYLDQGYAVITF